MSGSNSDLTLEELRAVFGDRADPETRARVKAEFDDPAGTSNRFFQGLRTLPTSVLGLALEAADARRAASADSASDRYDEIARVLEQVTAPYRTHSESLEGVSNRSIVDEVYLSVFGEQEPRRIEKLTFYRTVAGLMSNTLANHASSSLRGELPSSSDATAARADDSTFASSEAFPATVLSRKQSFDEFTQVQQYQALVYALFTFGGRTEHEIAVLLESSLSSVQEDLRVASIEIAVAAKGDS